MPVLHRRAALALAVCLARSLVAAAGLSPTAPVAPVASAASAAGAAQELRALALPASGAVNSAQARKLIKDLGKDILVLDVRTASEFGGGHIPGALNVPVASIEDRLNEIPPDRPTLIVCRAGKRAAKAYETLSKVRPSMVESGLWHLDANAEYKTDGIYVFRDR